MMFSKEPDRDRKRFYLERQKLIVSAEPEQVISLGPAPAEPRVLMICQNLVRQWMNRGIGINEPVT